MHLRQGNQTTSIDTGCSLESDVLQGRLGASLPGNLTYILLLHVWQNMAAFSQKIPVNTHIKDIYLS